MRRFDWSFFLPVALIFASLVLFSCCVMARIVSSVLSRDRSRCGMAPLPNWEQEKTPGTLRFNELVATVKKPLTVATTTTSSLDFQGGASFASQKVCGIQAGPARIAADFEEDGLCTTSLAKAHP